MHPTHATGSLSEIAAVALDYGSTISLTKDLDHLINQRPVDPEVVPALHTLHERGLRLVLASNTLPCETRWPALQAAGVDRLFTTALLSHALGVRKPEPLFYDLVVAACQTRPERILFVGDNITHDVAGPLKHGMHACAVQPCGVDRSALPPAAPIIGHLRELPDLLVHASPERSTGLS